MNKFSLYALASALFFNSFLASASEQSLKVFKASEGLKLVGHHTSEGVTNVCSAKVFGSVLVVGYADDISEATDEHSALRSRDSSSFDVSSFVPGLMAQQLYIPEASSTIVIQYDSESNKITEIGYRFHHSYRSYCKFE
jgi:hypothetical protein